MVPLISPMTFDICLSVHRSTRRKPTWCYWMLYCN